MTMTVCRLMCALSQLPASVYRSYDVDGSQSTGSSTLVGHSCLGRRYFNGETVDDQMSCPISSVVIQICRRDAANDINVPQELPRSALPTVTIILSTAAEV